MRSILPVLVLVPLLVACSPGTGERGGEDSTPSGKTIRPVPDIANRLAAFAPVRIEADLTSLDATERRVLDLLVEASRPVDEIFLLQANRENPRWRERLAAIPGRPGEDALAYFRVQYGIYERQADWRPFIVGAPPRPAGAGFYPPDLTRDEFREYVRQHPDREAELIGQFTIVERTDDGGLRGVPYSQAFAEQIGRITAKLDEAASITGDRTLAAYLEALSRALREDRYRDSDMAWMDQDGKVELTLGPYEVYEDTLFGYKASFESFVTVVDPAESKRLAEIKALLPDMERHLPIPDEHKNLHRGSASPIRVADLVFNAGDARAGIQTIAFNLPNDEYVREKKGSKKVLLRNMMAAKFDAILRPIAEHVLVPSQASLLGRDEFVDEVLFHELSHGLGPGRITKDGRTAEVREFLLEHYPPIEEAKADVVGMVNLLYMIEKGRKDPATRDALFATYVAGLFRSVRFGTAEAHGAAAATEFNLLLDAGALTFDSATGKVRIVFDRMPMALREVAHRLLMIEALGDREAAGELLASHGRVRGPMADLLASLEEIPVDIRPIFPVAGE